MDEELQEVIKELQNQIKELQERLYVLEYCVDTSSYYE